MERKDCTNCRWCSCRDYGKDKGACIYYIDIPKSENKDNKTLDNTNKL